jgi:hypothetical protein
MFVEKAINKVSAGYDTHESRNKNSDAAFGIVFRINKFFTVASRTLYQLFFSTRLLKYFKTKWACTSVISIFGLKKY